ncbi:hypothetical protein [Sandarakinorhabdus sp.]|uniref:hypothetical protein n=1 Tax=Sandarakinorhabdus sp. TaxID=1916663 RepID=UPI003F710C8F
MIIGRALLLAGSLFILALPVSAATGEWPERIRRQKEILTALGYFAGPMDTQDTEEFARARNELAQDAGLDTSIPIMLASQLERIYDRNQMARRNCPSRKGLATACLKSTASAQ